MYKYLSISISIGYHIVKLVITTRQKPTQKMRQTSKWNTTGHQTTREERKQEKNHNKQLTKQP